MKSFFQKFLKILVGGSKIIVILAFVGITIVYLIDDRTNTASPWSYLIPLSFPLVLILDRWSLKAARNQRFRLRIYLSICFLAFEIFTTALIPSLFESFAFYEPKIFNTESLFGITVCNALLFMLYWLAWGKLYRNQTDRQIIKNFKQVPNTINNIDAKVVELLNRTDLLIHSFHTNDPTKGYREYLPVMMTTKDGLIHFGSHYYDEHFRTAGANKHHIHLTYRHAYWLFPCDMPNIMIEKIGHYERVVGNTALNPEEMQFMETLQDFMEKFNFISVEISDKTCLLIRKFPGKFAALGESPISVEELWEITEEVKKLMVSKNVEHYAFN